MHYLQEDVQYGVNLDITSYTNGMRETHNPPGRALPYTVWDFYKVTDPPSTFVSNLGDCPLLTSSLPQSGCSIRMLNPQAFSSTVWNVLSILQEQFGSMAGANV